MSPIFRTACLVLGLALPVGCQSGPQGEAPEADGASDPGRVVAVLDGEAIHERDLEEWIRDDLYREALRGKNEQQLHEFHDQALRQMLDEALVQAEAERRGVEPDALRDEATAAAQVSDEEVRSFYEANASRLPEQVTFEAIAPRIREHLTQQKQARAWSRYLADLRSGADLEIRMEAPRADVEAVGPSMGAADADVTIVEFSDFSCPFCERVTPVLKEVLSRYPDRVRLVYRHFPLDRIHPRARATAEAAVCADEQDAFWPFHDLAFAADEPMDDDDLAEAAGSLGLDVEAFRACMEDGRAAQVVQRDLEAGMAAGVTGTPAFFINGIPLSGAQEVDAFVRIIDEEIARAEGDGEETASSS